MPWPKIVCREHLGEASRKGAIWKRRPREAAGSGAIMTAAWQFAQTRLLVAVLAVPDRPTRAGRGRGVKVERPGRSPVVAGGARDHLRAAILPRPRGRPC